MIYAAKATFDAPYKPDVAGSSPVLPTRKQAGSASEATSEGGCWYFVTATQGTTIEQPAAAPGNARAYYAGRIARAMSEMGNPPKAIGADGKILVPSSDPAKCIVWGSMWFRDTAPELRQLGFTELRCDANVWKL